MKYESMFATDQEIREQLGIDDPVARHAKALYQKLFPRTTKERLWQVLPLSLWSMIFGHPCAPNNCENAVRCRDAGGVNCYNIMSE